MNIHCCCCNLLVDARLTTGAEIYPHRPDLASLPFWRCDTCGYYVGCHHKTKDRTRPLGVIPTPQIKEARRHIHALIDPVWQSGKMPRGRLYAKLSDAIGYPYHTGELKSIDEARRVYRAAREIVGACAA